MSRPVIESIRAIPVTHSDLHGDQLNYLFVRISASGGLVGWGEVSDSYGCTHPTVAAAMVEDVLAPILVNRALTSVRELADLMRGVTRRRLSVAGVTSQAISGIEIALWDLAGKAEGVSVGDLIGRHRDRIPVYASWTFLDDGPVPWHLEGIAPCLDRGVTTVKVRLSLDRVENRDKIAEITSTLPHLTLFADAGESFSATAALAVARDLSQVGLRMLEEPVPQEQRAGIVRLVERSPIPIAYGEHVYSRQGFVDVLTAGMCDIIQPDPAIGGGIGECLDACRVAESLGIPVIPHAAGSTPSLAATLHLAAAAPNAAMFEYSFTLDRLWREVTRSVGFAPDALVDGALPVPDGPGLGIDIDESVLEANPFRPISPTRQYPRTTLGHAWA